MSAGPVFTKVREAAELIAASQRKEQHALSPKSVLMEGLDGTFLHVDYREDIGGIVLAFVGMRSSNGSLQFT
jgi:hypothetical protein